MNQRIDVNVESLIVSLFSHELLLLMGCKLLLVKKQAKSTSHEPSNSANRLLFIKRSFICGKLNSWFIHQITTRLYAVQNKGEMCLISKRSQYSAFNRQTLLTIYQEISMKNEKKHWNYTNFVGLVMAVAVLAEGENNSLLS